MTDVFPLPDVGEGLTEADIVTWKVRAGDTVTVNQILVEIETAKSLVELPSPQAGTIGALLVQEGETVLVGTPIVRFGAVGEAPAAAPSARAEESAEEGGGATLVGYGERGTTSRRRARANRHQSVVAAAPAPPPAAAPLPASTAPAESSVGDRPLAKPPVRRLAREHGVDLAAVAATGSRGEVTRGDLLHHLDGGAVPSVAPPAAAAPATGEDQRVPVRGVRKATAQAMVASAFTAPHVTEFLEVDVTGTMDLVRMLKAERTLGEDVRVSPLLVVARAVLWAIKRHPEINASWDEDAIILRGSVNLGIAAATPRGLLVPNIKGAERLDLAGLAAELGALIGLARAGRTPPADLAGGTITLTNVGVFGIDSGTPILNPGETAILAVGQIRKKPWVVDDEVAVREICQLAVSADHRVVDGEVISRFLADVGRGLEHPAIML